MTLIFHPFSGVRPLISTSGPKLGKRTNLVHPPGKSDVTLFHGTKSKDDADELQAHITLSKISSGDLHDTAVGTIDVCDDIDVRYLTNSLFVYLSEGVDGGFYLTDSLFAAAQFGCRNTILTDSEKKAGVMQQKSAYILGQSFLHNFSSDLVSYSHDRVQLERS